MNPAPLLSASVVSSLTAAPTLTSTYAVGGLCASSLSRVVLRRKRPAIPFSPLRVGKSASPLRPDKIGIERIGFGIKTEIGIVWVTNVGGLGWQVLFVLREWIATAEQMHSMLIELSEGRLYIPPQ
eukprot:1195861-Prorocentrum_minimum.AAC.4